MGIEALVLGVISAIRPATSQAAVFALLRAPAPARTLLAFTLAGAASSIAIGVLLVIAFNGVGGGIGKSDFTAAFDVIAGVAALGFAAGVQRGGLNRRPRRPGGSAGSGGRATAALSGRLHNPSVGTAALAGVATHVPGLIYLVALNTIAAQDPSNAEALVQVAIYNALWFAIPIAAFVLVLRSPGTATAYLDRLTAWARNNQERLLVVLFGALGLYLLVKGTVALVT